MHLMTRGLRATRKTITALLLAGVATAAWPNAAQAQDDARLRKIESELRALQRAVFPGGDGRYFTPEVDTTQARPQSGPGATPSSSALTDVLARLDALEAQLARLTARGEENANKLALLEKELEEAQAASTPPVAVTDSPAPATETGRVSVPGPTPTPAATTRSAPSAARLAAVQAIAKPSTGDPGDDEYSYGYRLWEAGFYPEAQQQLALFLEKYPRHARASYGRNLLGRAYLDNGQPREAATYFFENYQNDKQGARAGDSLLFLAEAMVAINDTNRACIALAEFSETYAALATGRLKEQYDRTRNKVRCTR